MSISPGDQIINFYNLIGKSPQMKKLYEDIKRVVHSSTVTVLILGESGTGKELIARAIHNASQQATKPFVEINCTALPESLLETELFGYEAGAFTDARKTKKGLLELADGGTFFLDEIGDMNIGLQSKLLKVLDEKAFRRVGGIRNIDLKMRIIAATNRDLVNLVQKGKFREDLYYRLNVISIRVPPLRERSQDILLLAEYYLFQFAAEHHRKIRGFSNAAKDLLLSYPWPGNVRELKNTIERVVLLSSSELISYDDLKLGEGHIVKNYPVNIRGSQKIEINFPPQGIPLDELEKAVLEKALETAEGNKAKAAKLLHITKEKFRYKLKKHGIDS